MTSDQQNVLRTTLQQVVDVAVGRAMWTMHPAVASVAGIAAFAIIWWLAGGAR